MQQLDNNFSEVLLDISKYGQFNMNVNTGHEQSFFASMKIIAREYVKAGINSGTLSCDKTFYKNVSNLIGGMVSVSFELPMSFDNDNITIRNIFGLNFNLQIVPLTGWEESGYSDVISNFAVIIPTKMFKSASDKQGTEFENPINYSCDFYDIKFLGIARANVKIEF